MPRLTPRLLPLAAPLVLWDLWPWLWRRGTENPDQGLLHLAFAAGVLLWWRDHRDPATLDPLWVRLSAAGLGICGGLALIGAYPLVRSLAAAGVLAAALLATVPRSRRLWPAVFGACALLPFSEETAAFLLGYPARVAAATVAAGMLRLGGFTVEMRGALLEVNGLPLFADAPCAGLHMGWTGLAIAALLCLYRETPPRRTLVVGVAALGLILFGNALRMVALAQVEHSPFADAWPRGLHNLVGMFCFLAMLPPLVWITRSPAAGTPAASTVFKPGPVWSAALVFALAAPVFNLKSTEPTPSASAPVDWPDTWEGKPLEPVEATEVDRRFAEGFPGRMARFQAGEASLLFRWLDAASRRLHPSVVCYRATGYRIEPRPAHRDASGALWSRYLARQGGEELEVRERIHSLSTGATWPDVSAWYWDAATGRDPGPWLAVTVAEPSR